MRVYDKKLSISGDDVSIESLAKACHSAGDLPIRLVVTNNRTDPCEVEVDFVDYEGFAWDSETDIFSFQKRTYENHREFNAVLVIPTGIGCEWEGMRATRIPSQGYYPPRATR